jgi:hypothetical protein
MTARRGHNRRVSRGGNVAPRLLVVALLALGLVGMHHLVVAACHHGGTHVGHSTMPASDATPSHSLHDPSLAALVHAPQESPDPATGGLVGAAATCLAILLMIIGLVLPRLVARLRRVFVFDRRPRIRHVVARLLEPPDLHLLSVSRT